MNSVIFLTIVLLALSSYFFGRKKAILIQSNKRLTALPKFYGYYLAIWCGAPAFLLYALWSIFEPSIVRFFILSDYSSQGLLEGELNLFYEKVKSLSRNQYSGELTAELQRSAEKYLNFRDIAKWSKVVIVLSLLIASTGYAYTKISNNTKTREPVEIFLKGVFFLSSLAAILTTIGIIFSLLFQTIEFFQVIPLFDFVFGMHWYPAKAFVRDASEALDPSMYSDTFGAVPIFAGTFFIALIAMCVAIPIGLLSGIYMAEYASKRLRQYAKPVIEILAGIPTVVYGYFALTFITPILRTILPETEIFNAASGAIVVGIMILPMVASLCDDALQSVPKSLKEGGYALGTTSYEVIRGILIPSAFSGIIASFVLALSRAFGETMAVTLAAGATPQFTLNPLESIQTMTSYCLLYTSPSPRD